MGALLAAGLALGKTASELEIAFREHGKAIFRKGILHSTRRMLTKAPYETKALKDVIYKILGAYNANKRMSEIKSPLLITAVNYSTGRACVFRSAGADPGVGTGPRLIDAILASAAAPTYFPMIEIDREEYIDGGVVANAPDLLALITALKYQKAGLEKCYMLSIGTAGWRNREALRDTARKPGALSWITSRGLVQTIMAAQETLALDQCSQLLGTRHLRIDREPDSGMVKRIRSLDKADDEAADALVALARDAWTQYGTTASLRNFLSR